MVIKSVSSMKMSLMNCTFLPKMALTMIAIETPLRYITHTSTIHTAKNMPKHHHCLDKNLVEVFFDEGLGRMEF
jgi:hypothetical protein